MVGYMQVISAKMELLIAYESNLSPSQQPTTRNQLPITALQVATESAVQQTISYESRKPVSFHACISSSLGSPIKRFRSSAISVPPRTKTPLGSKTVHTSPHLFNCHDSSIPQLRRSLPRELCRSFRRRRNGTHQQILTEQHVHMSRTSG